MGPTDNRLKDTIAVRFSKYYISKIDSLIAQGVFKNRSDLVRTATTELVSKVEVLAAKGLQEMNEDVKND